MFLFWNILPTKCLLWHMEERNNIWFTDCLGEEILYVNYLTIKKQKWGSSPALARKGKYEIGLTVILYI